MDLYKPKKLISLLTRLNTKPQKKLSQNFLVDKNIVDKIISTIDITTEDTLIEIGPGPGVITFEVLKKAKKLIVIEKDRIFSENLLQTKIPNLEVINEDFLKIDLEKFNFDKKIKLVSALPYHLTTPIIAKLLNSHKIFSTLTFMMQKEVAQRIVSKEGSKNYSSFSVFVNFYADAKIISFVSKNSFFPRPKVNSAIVQFTLKPLPVNVVAKDFQSLVKTAFSQRRKKAISLLSKKYKNANLVNIFNDLNIDSNSRAENISFDNYLALYKKLF